MVCGHQHQITIWRFNKMIFLFPLLCQLRAFTAAAKSSCFVSIRRSRIRTAMALWVRFSSLASFLATSRFKSQSGFLGAKFTKSYAKRLRCFSLEKLWNSYLICTYNFFQNRRFASSAQFFCDVLVNFFWLCEWYARLFQLFIERSVTAKQRSARKNSEMKIKWNDWLLLIELES